MKKIAVMTDSNSGVSQQDAKDLGITVVPMPFFINNKMYLEGITLDHEMFFEMLEKGYEITTSQPSPGDVIEAWDQALLHCDQIIHIPMSKNLSGGYATATTLAMDEKYQDKVFVVDSQRVSVTQRQACIDAIHMGEAGYDGAQIKKVLEEERLHASIYLTVDTLEYLKKGGRVTAAGAAIGTVLNIKPVLQIMGEKIDAYQKCRGWKAAKKSMVDAMRKDMVHKFHNQPIHLAFAHSCKDLEVAKQWKEEVEDLFPDQEVHMDWLSMNVICHTGPGALSLACSQYIDLPGMPMAEKMKKI